MSVGVDLHKGWFTVYWRSEEGSGGHFERYTAITKDKGSGKAIIATARKLSKIAQEMREQLPAA